ncbi:MAG: S-layer homology domain-containing protein, partial [Clostridia bacterium]|nr:S-layer homology domain-containing protein [Clostridia bacterium]
ADNYSKYTDFPTGWSKAAMEHAVNNGLLSGRTENTINPHDKLTRAEMATIINRVLGATITADISNYTDVASGSWYYSEFAKAANMKNFIGTSDTTMDPDKYITREAVFTVIARTLVLETSDYSSLDAFPDGKNVSDWAKSAAAVFVRKGYIKGNDEGLLCPSCYISREEFAQLMYNIIKTYYTKEGNSKQTSKDSTLIRVTGTTLENVTIEGDLIIADGVGEGTVNLKDVVINGRLLCRGGEGAIKLERTTVKSGVVVYDVNGTVRFDNYRTEPVFNNIRMITPAIFLKISGGASSNRRPGNRPDGPVIEPTDEPTEEPTEEPTTEPTEEPTEEPIEYHTVYFHNSVDPSVAPFEVAKINTALEDENKNLAALGLSLDTLYGNTGSKKVITYTRSSLMDNNIFDANEYSHDVEKEYLYEESAGVWREFTEKTTVNKDIHVYYGAKRMVVEATVPVIDFPYSLELVYDSESRIADSLKDGLIESGNTLANARGIIDEKVSNLYSQLNSKTKIVDDNGNILDIDYGLKIIDVIDYDQIQGEVKKYIDNMLNGSAEDLKKVISLFDIPTMVDQIGGKELISLISVDSIRAMLKEESFKAEAIKFIQDKIKSDTTVIESVLSNQTARESLIGNAAKNNAFIAKLMDYDAFKTEVLNIIKTETIKEQLLAQLAKENVKNEILSIIKNDTGFKNSIIDADDATIRKMLVGAVAEPGKVYNDNDSTYETMSASAKKVRDAVVDIVKNDPEYAAYKDEIETLHAYEAIIGRYVTGRNLIAGIRVTQDKLAMIDAVVIKVIEKYFSSDENAMNSDLSAIIDSAIIDLAKKYVNGEEIVEGNEDSDAQIKEIIEKNIIAFIKDYFAGNSSLANDAEIKAFAESIKTEFIEKAKKVDVATIKQPIIDFVTDKNNADVINSFVVDNYDSIVDSVDNEFIQNYINTISEEEAKDLVKKYANVDMIVSHITALTPEQRVELAKKIVKMLDTYKPYTEFMKAFKEKKDVFEINKSNTHFVTAVWEAIDGFDKEEIIEILKEKGFGTVIELLGGDEAFGGIFEASQKTYCDGLKPVIDEVVASPDENVKAYYTTKMNVEINVPLILRGIYETYVNDFRDNIKLNEVYDYDKNFSLQKFANIDWFNIVIGYDENRKEANSGISGATGYYIRDYMDYYCAMVDMFIIYDDALCFYNTEKYDDEKLVEVKKSLTKEVLNMLDKLNNLSDNIEQGKPIKGDFTLQDLINKVDSVKAFLGGNAASGPMASIVPVIDNMKNILTNLGEGNLPNGYTLDDLTLMTERLK